MKPILTTTALVALLSGPALAQTATAPTQGDSPFFAADVGQQNVSFDLRASELIGKSLYVSETDSDAMSDDWNNVGDISDVLMNRDGSTEAVLLDIGGFLGLGARTVAVSLDQLNFVRDGDGNDDYFVVVTATEEQLENAPEFDASTTSTWFTAENASPGDAGTGMATTDADRVTEPEADGEVERVEVMLDSVNTDNLIGARVYDTENEWVGEVTELVMTTEGSVEEVVLDIGGFLGMGEKQIAMAMEDLTLMRNADDQDELSVHLSVAGDTLEDMPDWTGSEN